MQPAENKKKIGVTINPKLHAKVKSAAPLRGTNLEGAYTEALESWLSRTETQTKGPTATQDLTAEEVSYVEALIYLLREGKEDYQTMVKLALKSAMGKKPRRAAKRDAA